MTTSPNPAVAPTPAPVKPPEVSPSLASSWTVGRRVVAVLAVFTLAVGAVMVAGQAVRPREEPWRSRTLDEARQKLLQEPKNEDIKKALREQDLELRRNYFAALQRNRTGGWLLLAAGVALVWLARESVRPQTPALPGALGLPADRERTGSRARTTVVATALVCGTTFLGLGLADRTHLPSVATGGLSVAAGSAPHGAGASAASPAATPNSTGSATATPIAPSGPSPEVWARQWPQFRGPDSSGVLADAKATVPESWDVATGKGVAWKSEVPIAGYNSPVVWENRVFLTGGDKKARLVFCYDTTTGALRWQRPVTPTNAPAAAVEPPDQSGAAASTVATDGERVYAVFASGELGALDFEGKLVWHKRLDFSENGYGHASSLVVHAGRLLVQADQGQAEDGKSALLALDVRTGETAWTAKRPVGGSWATPIVAAAGGRPLVFTCGDPWLMAHDATTGAEVWRAKVLGGELAPSPIFSDGLVVAVSPGHALVAVKADGTGDITESGLAWRLEQEVPDVPTPTVVGELLFTASTEGHVFCRELKTGTKIWEHAFETEFQASPLVAGERMYLFTQSGDGFIIAAGREFKELGTFKMGDEVYASPAVAAGRMYVRTKKTLYCLGVVAGPTQVADVR